MLRVSATTGDLPRKLAERLASEFFGQPMRYVEHHRDTSESSIQRLITALLDADDDRLALVEAVFDNSPLPESPRIIVSDFTRGGIASALQVLGSRVGALFDSIHDIRQLEVRWQGSCVPLCFPVVDGLRVVQVWDSRIDNNVAERFAEFMRDDFGLEVLSVETRRA